VIVSVKEKDLMGILESFPNHLEELIEIAKHRKKKNTEALKTAKNMNLKLSKVM
jgi:hypothetical protein